MNSFDDDRDFCQGGDDLPEGHYAAVRHQYGADWYYWQGLWWGWDAMPDDGKRWHRWCREAAV